jgi:DMSO/TMAO reductase YedYZ molybdopterin-dependent catalytic subunit
MHWTNAIAMIIMIMSGWGIYDDYVIIHGLHFSSTFRLGSWAAPSLLWHFAGMWLLALNGLAYLVYGIVTGRLRERMLPIRFRELVQTVRDTLHFKIEHDDLTVYNAVQKLLYIVVIVAGISQVDHGSSDLEADSILVRRGAARRLSGGTHRAFRRDVGDRGIFDRTRCAVAAGAANAVGHAERGSASSCRRESVMRSPFRPSKPPDPRFWMIIAASFGSSSGAAFCAAASPWDARDAHGLRCELATRGRQGAALVSSWNDRVQAALFDPNHLAPTYPKSMILRPPKFNAYYDITEVKPVDAQTWKLELAGLISDKRPWTAERLAACPRHRRWSSSTSVSRGGTTSAAGPARHCAVFWSGWVRIYGAKYVAFKTADDYPSSIDMATALHPQTLLATKYAGAPLADPFGFPVRLRMATKLGYKNPKWITAIEVTNRYPGGYWENLGENWFAGILYGTAMIRARRPVAPFPFAVTASPQSAPCYLVIAYGCAAAHNASAPNRTV